MLFSHKFNMRHKKIKSKKYKIVRIVIICALSIAAFLYLIQLWPSKHITWGVSYSPVQATSLGLDPKATYSDMLRTLQPKKVRLMTYWDTVEAERGKFTFSDIDAMLKEAGDHHTQILLVVGLKQPRWPECHSPSWYTSLSSEDKQKATLSYIRAMVEHAKASSAVVAWQVENEPFFDFGPNCPTIQRSFLKQEVALVKSLDSRPVLVTDSGELGFWLPVATTGADYFGSTMYRTVHNQRYGYITYPIPPLAFRLKAGLLRLLVYPKQIVGVELQAEPWFLSDAVHTNIDEQKKLMNKDIFEKNIAYARAVGFADNYLWGVEWWYWLSRNYNDNSMLVRAKQLFQE